MPSKITKAKLKTYLPKADDYLLSELLYNNYLTENGLRKEITALKQNLKLAEDNLIIDILLFRQSKIAAPKKAKVLKAQKILVDLANKVSLDKEYFDLLNHVYAQVSSKILLPDIIDYTVDSLLEMIQEPRAVLKARAEANLKFLNDLYTARKFTLKTFRNLYLVYAFEGAPELKSDFDNLVNKIAEAAPEFKHKEELAAKVFLAEIAEEEIGPILSLSTAFHYPLNLEDLETIYFKYSELPPIEVQKIFNTILLRLPHKEEPYENLALAVKILKDGREEIFNKSLQQASNKQNKLNYMKALATVPFFVGYEDELTLKFYGKQTLMDVALDFKELLKSLPFSESYKENADIGIKVLLGKIPYKAGYAQALYRKENKGQRGEDPLRLEALQKYSGPQSKEDVLEFFRLKLKLYTFYKKDGAAYCAALAYLIDELNGKNPPKATTVALELFEQGLNEKQVEEIVNKFLQKVSFDEDALLTAYKRFFEINHDKEDAVERLLNMLD